jgi:hypothetical protein
VKYNYSRKSLYCISKYLSTLCCTIFNWKILLNLVKELYWFSYEYESRAKQHRGKLMDERKYFISQNNELLFERPFLLYEHWNTFWRCRTLSCLLKVNFYFTKIFFFVILFFNLFIHNIIYADRKMTDLNETKYSIQYRAVNIFGKRTFYLWVQ